MSLPDIRSAPSILVIDDQPTVRRMAHRLLSEWGFRVFEAESGEEGMEVLETARAGLWTTSSLSSSIEKVLAGLVQAGRVPRSPS